MWLLLRQLEAVHSFIQYSLIEHQILCWVLGITDDIQGQSHRPEVGCPVVEKGASLVAQMIKNLPAMQKSRVLSLG